ncbi:hypothetical protein [Microbispora sp. NPDC049633]|uniref:hypothetical protein n=1 Tax=Microbispora sp. NPDC049633 TaxID=3154355 RepID=UPI003444CEE3
MIQALPAILGTIGRLAAGTAARSAAGAVAESAASGATGAAAGRLGNFAASAARYTALHAATRPTPQPQHPPVVAPDPFPYEPYR